ncbi:tetraprenyl-beta-curcumene synthase family protein [Alkalihalobacillus sp. CinArs1]|uniref:tetraprenyl-beta-curcumene synthase family protein n=1 Tax=Alkalihalobacillus sp. CinArs1 TaxID=2995314 RepID=UPI0022DE4F36|nr:tetraprenyl-beta-curcumene synthase family protein [Alkalihalobacillus sp. CinArs1]
MNVPTQPWTLMLNIYKRVLPRVHKELSEWKEFAERIPNKELRTQAIASIDSKTFHCEGGAIYGLLAGNNIDQSIKFIAAYQTISDYLDNLCDRSTSLNPEDFSALHESMIHALSPKVELTYNYYRYREEQDDGGYLKALVKTCQDVVRELPNFEEVQPALLELCRYYCDLQIHKHVIPEERVPRLEKWFNYNKEKLPDMSWHEFSACAGSTLGIFCLVSYSLGGTMPKGSTDRIKKGYFPWVQGLHIMLDYFIDQEEDRVGGDLNFCFYYQDNDELAARVGHFIKEADKSVKNLPHSNFHRLINKGLLGIYLADKKVMRQKDVRSLARKIIQQGGKSSLFFYFNGWVYRRIHKASQ